MARKVNAKRGRRFENVKKEGERNKGKENGRKKKDRRRESKWEGMLTVALFMCMQEFWINGND